MRRSKWTGVSVATVQDVIGHCPNTDKLSHSVPYLGLGYSEVKVQEYSRTLSDCRDPQWPSK